MPSLTPLILVLLATCALTQTPPRPIIGIVTIPTSDTYTDYPPDSWSYFPASYVKFIESGGAQVVPIQYDLPEDKIIFLLQRLNGVLFTGGDAAMAYPNGTLTRIGQALNTVVNYVVQQNTDGKFYPLWGTCMGFEAIGGLLQRNFSILTPDCNGCQKVNKNNEFNLYYQSRLFKGLDQDLVKAMQTGNISLFAHTSMFHADTFQKAYPLKEILTPVTFSYDNSGVKYVSSYESPRMPIYGTQFHQEKHTFEWKSGYYINHNASAVRLQQHLSNFFVNETRSNTNTFPEFQSYLIENHNLTIILNSTFSSIYVFPLTNQLPLEKAHEKVHSHAGIKEVVRGLRSFYQNKF